MKTYVTENTYFDTSTIKPITEVIKYSLSGKTSIMHFLNISTEVWMLPLSCISYKRLGYGRVSSSVRYLVVTGQVKGCQ